MPLNSVLVALDDKDHTRLDGLILDSNPPDYPPALLALVVTDSDGMLDPRYQNIREADKLLAEYPELHDRIKTAYAAQSYKDIRTLEILQSSKPKRLSHLPAANGKAIAAAWDQPYRGNCDKTLRISLADMTREGPYSNVVSIIQSSGTGKSRMVDQLALSVFAIPFNIRSADDNRDLAFPPPDDAIRTHIVAKASASGTTVENIERFYLCFLASLFSKTKDELERGRAQQRGKKSLAAWWRDHLRQPDVRSRLYSSVVNEAEGLTVETLDVAARKAKDAFKELSVTIHSLDRSLAGALKIIYFDEAHTLMIPSPKDKSSYSGEDSPDKYLYDILCSALNNFLPESLLVLFLSTASHLYQLTPSGALARSARARSNIHNLQAPITETPFDCSPDPIVHPHKLTLKDTCDVEFMSRFGRPLFWTMLRGAGHSKSEVMLSIINLARAKLLCQDAIDVKATDVGKTARTAVVDVRLMLDYEPIREASHQLQAELVASHMRICYSVPQSREYMRSGYPSEPILAEAAAQQMYAFRKRDPRAILNILKDNMDGGLLDRGERGELVGRELLLSAYDRAIEREDEARQRSETPLPDISTHDPASFKPPRSYSCGVSLIAFIEELFTEENAQQVLESLPDNIKCKTTFRDAFKDAKVRFTHFVKMGDSTGTTSAASWVALTRGMAIITRSGEVAVDVIIPILLRDAKLCEEVVSGLLVQFKRRRHSGPKASYLIDQRTIGLFPKGSPDSESRPYISLVMELGVQPKGTVPAKELPKSGPPASTTPSKLHVMSQGRLRHARDTHPRFGIFAYGCSDTVYKGISLEQRATYQFLLASRDFLAEHPRQHRGALDAVGRMKPLWKAGSASYDWVDEKVLQGDDPEIPTDDDDRLVTTFFDDDLEESESGPDGGGEDPFNVQAPEQYGEPSGLDSRQQHEMGSGGEDPVIAPVPIQRPHFIVQAPEQYGESSRLDSRQQHEMGSGGEDPVIAPVPIQQPIQQPQSLGRSSRKKRRVAEKARTQPSRTPRE